MRLLKMAMLACVMLVPAGALANEGPTAFDLAMKCVCPAGPNRDTCMENESLQGRVREAVESLTSVSAEFELPPYVQPLLVAMACGESGFQRAPTCWADKACVQDCMDRRDYHWDTLTPSEWHRCTTECGGTATCNDRGTSAGMFQFKWGGAGRLAREQGVNLYDPASAGRFYIGWLLDMVEPSRGSDMARRLTLDCGPMSTKDRWRAAILRATQGPTKAPAREVFIQREDGGMVSEMLPRIPRCRGVSKYAVWAERWAELAPDAWSPNGELATN